MAEGGCWEDDAVAEVELAGRRVGAGDETKIVLVFVKAVYNLVHAESTNFDLEGSEDRYESQ